MDKWVCGLVNVLTNRWVNTEINNWTDMHRGLESLCVVRQEADKQATELDKQAISKSL